MSYGIEGDPDARRILLSLDPVFALAVLDGAERLADTPTRLSRPNGFPFYGTEPRYHFDVEGREVTLFFLYSRDEETIHIVDVSVLPPPPRRG